MCGFTGFIDLQRERSGEQLTAIVREMADALVHRGPDDGGAWCDEQAGIALGFRRLSIIDLSTNGAQPMHSHCGRYVIVFNGELYNHGAIRRELEAVEAVTWRGHSDTEVLLRAVAIWGVETALHKFNGMFAFALWDTEQGELFLSRDRLGEKPLYYGTHNGNFLFGSELKALAAHPCWSPSIDREALCLYMRHGYIPAPHSIYRGISKLTPGTFLRVTLDGGGTPARTQKTAYWSVREVTEEALREPLQLDDQGVIDEFDRLLRACVQMRMVADVPLGAFLSGGIDSSIIVAAMQADSSAAVQTFTIGFEQARYNEAQHAKRVAQHLKTDHHELYLSASDALDVVPKLPKMYDEPFADPSQIPTYLVACMARRNVTVALSGDGGDELFGGYARYLRAEARWQQISRAPGIVRRSVSRGLDVPQQAQWAGLFDAVRPAVPARFRGRLHAAAVGRVAEMIGARSISDVYLPMISAWSRPTDLVLRGAEPPTIYTDRDLWPTDASDHQLMGHQDTLAYLPDDILVKVDRAAMAVSLETRIPLLDPRIVRFAARLPARFKVRDGQGKWLLRQVLEKYVPRSITDRPKMGFGVPIEEWLRGPLRDWAEDLLAPQTIAEQGYLDTNLVQATWREHLDGANRQGLIWPVLMFQSWLKTV